MLSHGKLRKSQKLRRPGKPVICQIFLGGDIQITAEQFIEIRTVNTHIFRNVRHPYGVKIIVTDILHRPADMDILPVLFPRDIYIDIF